MLPANTYPAVILNGDTVACVDLPNVYVYPPIRFYSKREEAEYTKLVRDVKRVMPLAKYIYITMIETTDYLETLPNKRAKDAHLKRMQKDLLKSYEPELRKLTLSQGMLLLKLINRECNQPSYDIIKAYMGGFQAGLWNGFAKIFGASLKTDYDKYGKDALLERVCVGVENRSL